MRNFQDTFETRERSFISACSICMTVPLKIIENLRLKQFILKAIYDNLY